MAEAEFERLNFVVVPNGATHFRSLNQSLPPMWHRLAGKRIDRWDDRRQAWEDFDASNEVMAMLMPISDLGKTLRSIIKESQAAAWDVAALPPVGLTCEVENPHEDGHWCQCTIIAWEAECAVFRAASDYPYVYDGRGVGCFRPSRTQEVVNHARHEAVMELGALLIDNRGDSMEYHQAGLIYDAGWRKPEAAQ